MHVEKLNDAVPTDCAKGSVHTKVVEKRFSPCSQTPQLTEWRTTRANRRQAADPPSHLHAHYRGNVA
jgi:hypothetical protein